MKIMKRVVAILLCVFISVAAYSQKKKKTKVADELQVIKEFIATCNGYKKLPLHVEVEQENTAFFPASDEDTMRLNAEFTFTSTGSYVRYGNIEQISDDSLMLVVSNDQRVMMLYPHAQNIEQLLTSLTGSFAADSSLKKLYELYSSQFLAAEGEKTVIELKSRMPLPGTDQVKEIIKVKYKSQNKEPDEIIYLRRTLVPVDSVEFASLGDKAIKKGGGWFLVNERVRTYRFKKISHEATISLPVNIAQRIKKVSGEYVAAKGYEGYYISME
jgi:hypothetical protein